MHHAGHGYRHASLKRSCRIGLTTVRKRISAPYGVKPAPLRRGTHPYLLRNEQV
jgi:hypothetical protein